MNAHEGSPATTRDEARRQRDDAVIARLASLAAALDGEPDPAFRTAARTRLVAMAAVRTPEIRTVAVRARWRRRLTAGLATVAVAAAVLSALVAFAAGSGPGDLLYGVKRGSEQTELALAGDSRRGPVLLDLASTRLVELRALAGERAPEPALVRQTLHTMDTQTADAAAWFAARALDRHTAAPLDQLFRWSSGQWSGLEALDAELPAAVSTAVEHSLDLLAATRSRADAVRATLPVPSGPPAVSRTPASPSASRSPSASFSPSTSGSPSIAHPPGAPTSAVRTPAPTALPSAPARSGSTAATPTPGGVPTPTSSGASPVIGGSPPVSVPSAGASQTGLPPLPTLPLPRGTAVCVGPFSPGRC